MKLYQGFTLIELLVVIAVLGVLAAGVLVAINPLQRINQANDAKIKSDVGQITNALQAYYVTNQHYPATVSELVTSQDLKTEPIPPNGATSYTTYLTSTASGCSPGDANSSKNCADISIAVPLNAPQTPGGSWQWDSSTGQAGEYVPPTPTPSPLPSSTPTPSCDPTGTLLTGLVGYWTFDSTAWSTNAGGIRDSSGMGNNGTVSGSADNATSGPSLAFDKAGNFNGSSDSINAISGGQIAVPLSNSLKLSSNMSISVWVNPRSGFTNAYRAIVYSDSYGRSYDLALDLTGKVRMYFDGYPVLSNAVVQPGVWTHIVTTFDGTTVKIYVNGVSDTSNSTHPGSMTAGLSNLIIGAADGNYYHFLGLIDDLRIYNHVLSGQQDVPALYNSRKGCTI